VKRRTAIKRLAIFGGFGVLSFSSYKLFTNFYPRNLSQLDEMKLLISSLTETILPETNTPGSNSVNVDAFVIKMIKYCVLPQSQTNFINGLQLIEKFCLKHFGCSFLKCTKEQKNMTLSIFDKNQKNYGGMIGKVYRKIFGEPFMLLLKQYTVQGYCTSKVGAFQVLNYNSIPGKYIGCTILDPGQLSWATR